MAKQTRRFSCAACGKVYEVTAHATAFKRMTGTPACSHACIDRLNGKESPVLTISW